MSRLTMFFITIYPDPQGMAYVVKPDGQGSFEIIANMLPEDWSQL